jgi:hypothetical protein
MASGKVGSRIMKAARLVRNSLFAMAVACSALLSATCSDDPGAAAACHFRSGSGSIQIKGRISDCPTITSFVVNPQRLRVGESSDLRGLATDPDSANLSFAWTASSGVIADGAVAVTNFRCTEEGTATLTLTVSDGSCQDNVVVQAECVR